jgi:hypothetical protein
VYLQLELRVFSVALGVENSQVPLHAVQFSSLYTYWLTQRPNGLLQSQQQYTENNTYLDTGMPLVFLRRGTKASCMTFLDVTHTTLSSSPLDK